MGYHTSQRWQGFPYSPKFVSPIIDQSHIDVLSTIVNIYQLHGELEWFGRNRWWWRWRWSRRRRRRQGWGRCNGRRWLRTLQLQAGVNFSHLAGSIEVKNNGIFISIYITVDATAVEMFVQLLGGFVLCFVDVDIQNLSWHWNRINAIHTLGVAPCSTIGISTVTVQLNESFQTTFCGIPQTSAIVKPRASLDMPHSSLQLLQQCVPTDLLQCQNP
mmetsp:Transcript_26392/g.47674  ORF Transcript_26392/g.47674 Transcript_26392/m.47674 type:complete len:216 (-) Transcript_26392:244-891(-)